MDRREHQSGHPPELAWPAPHRVADRAAGPRPAVHTADRRDHQPGRHPAGEHRSGRPGEVPGPAHHRPDRRVLPARAPGHRGHHDGPAGRAPGPAVTAVGARPGRPAPGPARSAGQVRPGVRPGPRADRRRAGLPDVGRRHGRRAERIPPAAGPGVRSGRHAELRRGAAYADRGDSRHVRRHRPQPGQRRAGGRNRVRRGPRRCLPVLRRSAAGNRTSAGSASARERPPTW